jgi:hypothetical protein
VSSKYEKRWELWRHGSWDRLQEWWAGNNEALIKASDFKKENNSINLCINVF